MKKQKHISYEKALKKSMYLCGKAEKCKSDIRKKLFDWKAKPDDHPKVIKELERLKFIDEERYTSFYVRDKFRFNKWGRIKIKSMLFQKQIPEKLIVLALTEIKEDEYIEMLKNVINQKSKHLKETDPYKLKSRLLHFAGSRGFEADLILKVLAI